MTQKLNWKAKALSQYKTAIALAEAMEASEDRRENGKGLVQIGRAMALQELLSEYGVDVDTEQDSTPKIILPGAH